MTSLDEQHVISENWQLATTSNELPEKWKGVTIFDYIPDEQIKKPITIEYQVPEQIDDILATTIKGVDRWTKDGRIWTRHHVSSRITLFRPELAVDGPSVAHLEDERVTTMRTTDGETTTVSDNWRDPTRTDLTTKCIWTGVAVFNEKGHYPPVVA